jgi:hypothetical protein
MRPLYVILIRVLVARPNNRIFRIFMTAMDPKTPTISRGRKLLACLPFFLVVGLVTNTWCKFYRHEYEPSLVHYVTVALVGINGVLLVIRFKPGLQLTGVILLFAAFGLLHFFEYTYQNQAASGRDQREQTMANKYGDQYIVCSTSTQLANFQDSHVTTLH